MIGTTAAAAAGDGGSARGRQKTPPKSQAINIPRAAADVPLTRRPNNNFSSSELIVPATHLPFPPPQAGKRSGSSYIGLGAGGPRGHQPRHGRPQRLSQVYDAPTPHRPYQHDPATPPSPPSFNREVVQSSIPLGLDVDTNLFGEEGEEQEPPVVPELQIDDSTLVEEVAIPIIWRGGGKEVILARAGDDEWNGRQPMEKESVTLFFLFYPVY
jgi:hypothetical protein